MPKSPLNSTSAPLGIAGVFTGRPQTVDAYSQIRMNGHTDAAGTLFVEQSINGVVWDFVNEIAVLADTPFTLNVDVEASEMRVRYVNGAVAQTFFRLQTLLYVDVNDVPTSNEINNKLFDTNAKLDTSNENTNTTAQNTASTAINTNETNNKLDALNIKVDKLDLKDTTTTLTIHPNSTGIIVREQGCYLSNISFASRNATDESMLFLYDSVSQVNPAVDVPIMLLYSQPYGHEDISLSFPVKISNGIVIRAVRSMGTIDPTSTTSCTANAVATTITTFI